MAGFLKSLFERWHNGKLKKGILPIKGLAVSALLVLAFLTQILSGCTGKALRVLDPQILASFEVTGEHWYIVPESALSPDGKYMAVVNRGSQRYELLAVALEGSEPEMIAIESVDRQWISNNFFAYRPLAWASDERLIYAKHGWQKGGIHEGQRGLAIMAANIKDKAIEEIYFMELPLGCYLRDQAYVPQKDKVYLAVRQATGNSIWEMDLKTNELRLIKDRLPTYDGLFYAKISPDGSCYVYNLYEEDRNGIFILDVTTGEERPLLPNGDTMSFYRTGHLTVATWQHTQWIGCPAPRGFHGRTTRCFQEKTVPSRYLPE